MTAVPGRCRSCGAALTLAAADLGNHPLASWFPSSAELDRPEPRWLLRAVVCETCWLVQLDGSTPAEDDPAAHVSLGSPSPTLQRHGAGFVQEALARLAVPPSGPVIEFASHGGYLGAHVRERGWPTLAIEANSAIAGAARSAGIPLVEGRFGPELAAELVARHGQAKLLVDNYVLAHIDDLERHVAGLSVLLAPDGLLMAELDHLLPIIVGGQFDAIRHGHFTYFSLVALQVALARYGLVVVEASQQPVYGGALRVAIRHGDGAPAPSSGVQRIVAAERSAGLCRPDTYRRFGDGVARARDALLAHLLDARRTGKTVIAYGAPSRGNTLLNYCQITTELVPFTVDVSPDKQGRFLPGTRLPILAPRRLLESRPDEILILVWDLADEIVEDLAEARSWGARFLVPLPSIRVIA